MKKVKEIINLLHDGLQSVDKDGLADGSFFYVDKSTGETIEVAERFEGHSAYLVDKIKKSINDKILYSTIYQKSMEQLVSELKGNELRILFYFISKMGYENAVFGITYRGVSKKLGISVRTVTDSVNGLINKNLLKRYGSTQKKVYYVNPAVAWKGSKLNIRKKTGMFIEREKKIERNDSGKRNET